MSFRLVVAFNDFKRQLYGANDRLRLNFIKEKRLPMIEGGDEYAQNNKGDPYGCIDRIQIIKTKLINDRMRNTEPRTM